MQAAHTGQLFLCPFESWRCPFCPRYAQQKAISRSEWLRQSTHLDCRQRRRHPSYSSRPSSHDISSAADTPYHSQISVIKKGRPHRVWSGLLLGCKENQEKNLIFFLGLPSWFSLEEVSCAFSLLELGFLSFFSEFISVRLI